MSIRDIQRYEQTMQYLLEERYAQLADFANDSEHDFHAAKAFICAAIARHYAIRVLEAQQNETP